MSNRYNASLRGAVGPAAGAAFAEFRNSSTRRCQIEEIGFFNAAATLGAVGIVRSNAQGTGGATTLLGQAEDPNNPAATATLAVAAFTSAPTFTATNAMRRSMIPASIGAGIIWSWPGSDRLIVAPSASLVFFNQHTAAATAAWDIYVTWIE